MALKSTWRTRPTHVFPAFSPMGLRTSLPRSPLPFSARPYDVLPFPVEQPYLPMLAGKLTDATVEGFSTVGSAVKQTTQQVCVLW